MRPQGVLGWMAAVVVVGLQRPVILRPKAVAASPSLVTISPWWSSPMRGQLKGEESVSENCPVKLFPLLGEDAAIA
jgi:hypothetical protein